jgi:hypothetical protein|tara:strand:- start:429 stop:902 length:474 start_codon:yes stop_codon:yes gene_type:complete
MKVQDIIEALGVSRPTYYIWKKREDFPKEGSTLEDYQEYADQRKQTGHESKQNSVDKSEGSMYARKLELDIEKKEAEIKKIYQQLYEGRDVIIAEHNYMVGLEWQGVFQELITYMKEEEVYDGAKLKTLYESSLEAVVKRLPELAEQVRIAHENKDA